MKKVLSVMAVSAFVLTAGVAFAGGPGKKATADCPAACQQQIDDLNSSQAQQNEQLGAHGKKIVNHEGRITTLEKSAYNPWYVRLGARASWMTQDIVGSGEFGYQNEWDSEMGWGGNVAVGRQFGQFRAELELGYQAADLDDKNFAGDDGDGYTWSDSFTGEQNIMTFMVNGYYEIPVADAFAVYAMAGIGMAKYDLKVNYSYAEALDGVVYETGTRTIGDASDNVLAYKLGAGVTYNFSEQIAGDLGYEYFGVADTNIAESINSHNVVASVRFKF